MCVCVCVRVCVCVSHQWSSNSLRNLNIASEVLNIWGAAVAQWSAGQKVERSILHLGHVPYQNCLWITWKTIYILCFKLKKLNSDNFDMYHRRRLNNFYFLLLSRYDTDFFMSFFFRILAVTCSVWNAANRSLVSTTCFDISAKDTQQCNNVQQSCAIYVGQRSLVKARWRVTWLQCTGIHSLWIQCLSFSWLEVVELNR